MIGCKYVQKKKKHLKLLTAAKVHDSFARALRELRFADRRVCSTFGCQSLRASTSTIFNHETIRFPPRRAEIYTESEYLHVEWIESVPNETSEGENATVNGATVTVDFLKTRKKSNTFLGYEESVPVSHVGSCRQLSSSPWALDTSSSYVVHAVILVATFS
ncbi:uncharacterized protein LOC143431159 [Xylocopa sonorina]|uniref:uncharacterized protein LOC143431159 n=1 Tax=Xylocopa sonorina TaxID=1818115 RepID=UPI00403B1D69